MLTPPRLNIPRIEQAVVLDWYPTRAIVQTTSGRKLVVHNPYSSQVHRRKVLIARMANGEYTIVGVA